MNSFRWSGKLEYLGSNQVVERLLLKEENLFHHPHQHLDQKVASDVDGDQDSNHDQPSPCFKVAVEILAAKHTSDLHALMPAITCLTCRSAMCLA